MGNTNESDHEIVFGTPEHIAGLSRKALEEDFLWVQNRRMLLESECERLDSENAKLREACADLLHMAESHDPEWLHWPELHDELRELGIEV